VHVVRQFHATKFAADLPTRKFLEFLFGGGSAANVATARNATPVTRNRRFVEFFLGRIEAILGRSSALGRLLKHGLQGST
jgi:hypothetical protein